MIKVEMPYVKTWEDAVMLSQELVDELVFDELIDTNTIDMYVQQIVKKSERERCFYED